MSVSPRLLRRLAVLGLTVGAVAVPLAAPAHAVTGPFISVSAHQLLVANQTVSVAGDDFVSGHVITILECSSATGGVDCDTGNAVSTTTDSDGNLPPTNIRLDAGAIGTGGNYCPSKTAGGACFIYASTDLADPTNLLGFGTAEIDFAPIIDLTPSNVTSGASINVAGYGFPHTAQPIDLLQCASISATGCDTSTAVVAESDSAGTFTGAIAVHGGQVGDGTCSTGGTCDILALSNTVDPQPGSYATAVFTLSVPVARPTALAASARSKGHLLVIKGTITSTNGGVKGLKITAFERPKGSHKWLRAATATSGKTGAITITSLHHLSHPEQYRLTHATQHVKIGTYGSSTSNVVTVA